jgi:hypothetical protein
MMAATLDHRQTQLGGRNPEQRARTLLRQRRQRIILRHRRKKRRIDALARNSDFPFGFRIIRLQLLVGDRPVRQSAARNRPFMGGFVEFIREVPPTAGPVGHRPAAHDAPITVRAWARFFLVIAAEGVALPRRIAHQPVDGILRIQMQQLVLDVILFVPISAPPALLQDHHGKTGHRQFLGHHRTAGPGSDHDKIHFRVGRESFHCTAAS